MNWEELNQKLTEIAKINNKSKAQILREAGVKYDGHWYARRKAAIKKVEDYLFSMNNPDEADQLNEEFLKFLDKKQAKKIDWREWFEHAEKHQKLHDGISQSQDSATIEIKTEKQFIAIIFSADWHLGSISVDYKDLRENIEYLLNTDGLYLITVGDLTDNFTKFKSMQPVLSQIFSPREQARILASIIKELTERKKWLAACWGNHDVERDEKMIGFSIVKEMLASSLIYFREQHLQSNSFKH